MMAPAKFGLVGYGFGGHYFHGLAVICDKPFATDAEAAQGTVRLAAEVKS